ncbi:hypothetical protein T484DRAFT_1912084 [Baffinella frigidus]|nr:hypothetical protein T484DRAFT_1912084 [Cryptophyta sp. CCMP2293]
MRTFVLAVARVFRDDYVPPVHPRSKSADDLLPRTHAKATEAALPGFQRCASEEGSTGWVTHEELLAHRHSTRRQRRAVLDFPKLMSSWDVDAEIEAVEKERGSQGARSLLQEEQPQCANS